MLVSVSHDRTAAVWTAPTAAAWAPSHLTAHIPKGLLCVRWAPAATGDSAASTSGRGDDGAPAGPLQRGVPTAGARYAAGSCDRAVVVASWDAELGLWRAKVGGWAHCCRGAWPA
jgi:hypothetical protein